MTEQQQRRALSWLGWVVIIMAVVFVAQGVYYQYESRKLAACQFEVSQEFKRQIISNRQQSNDTRQALIDFLTNLRSDQSADDFDDALLEYLRLTEQQQEKALRQAEHDDEWLRRC